MGINRSTCCSAAFFLVHIQNGVGVEIMIDTPQSKPYFRQERCELDRKNASESHAAACAQWQMADLRFQSALRRCCCGCRRRMKKRGNGRQKNGGQKDGEICAGEWRNHGAESWAAQKAERCEQFGFWHQAILAAEARSGSDLAAESRADPFSHARCGNGPWLWRGSADAQAVHAPIPVAAWL